MTRAITPPAHPRAPGLFAGLIGLCLLAGGAGAQPRFTDVTLGAGITYAQNTYTGPPCLLGDYCEPEYHTGGAAAGDYDNDGFIDLAVSRFTGPALIYRNRGDGTFQQLTSTASGISANLPSDGVAWGDVDNDGDLDLALNTIGVHPNYLYINDLNNGGTGRLTNRAAQRGVALDTGNFHFSYSIAFGDYDRDGYIDFHTCEWGYPAHVVPTDGPTHSRLFRNQGAAQPGYFTDVTDLAGVSANGHSPEPGRPGSYLFASTFVDLDDDGWADLVEAGDFSTSHIYWNNRDGTFVDGTVEAGVATDENGMGSTFGDYDGDGRLDWFVTSIYITEDFRGMGGNCDPINLSLSGNRLYHNEGGRLFSDRTDEKGLRMGYWGWGAQFFDFDNDGDLDVVQTNGIDLAGAPLSGCYWGADPSRLWRNDGDGAMTEISQSAGVTSTKAGKGLLVFDYDNDGDLDVFIVNNAGQATLYRNDGGNANGWLRVKVTGTQSNRQGLGAVVRVRATADGPWQLRKMGTEYGFLGQSEGIAHFGLGAGSAAVSEVRVEWPLSGQTQVFTDVARNTTLGVTEPGP